MKEFESRSVVDSLLERQGQAYLKEYGFKHGNTISIMAAATQTTMLCPVQVNTKLFYCVVVSFFFLSSSLTLVSFWLLLYPH